MRPVLPAGMTQPAAQGGRTSTRVHTVVQPPWGRRRQSRAYPRHDDVPCGMRPTARRCAVRSPSMYGMFDPLGADDDGRATLRGFAALTHGYRVVRPLRGRLPGEAVRSATHGTTMCRPCGVRPVTRRCADRAGCDPRHDDVQAVRDAAPWGPNYSITAGEHGEPAEEQPPPTEYVPKGGEHPRPCGPCACSCSTPLGPNESETPCPRVSMANPRKSNPHLTSTSPKGANIHWRRDPRRG